MNYKKLTSGQRVRDNKISDRVYDKYFIVCVTDYATYDESLIKESDLETIGHGLYTWAGLKGYINKIIKGTGLSTEFKIDKSSYTYSCYFVDANGKHKAYIGFGILETPDADLLNTLQYMNVPSISDSRKVKDGFYQDWGVNGYRMDNYPYYKVLINGDSQGIVCDNEDEAIEYAQKVDKRLVSKSVNIEVRLYTAENPDGELVWSNNISDSRRVKDSRGMDDFDYLIDAYGFVVPLGMKVSGKEFADRIKRVYSLENERNAYFYELAKDLAWVEHNTRGFDWSF